MFKRYRAKRLLNQLFESEACKPAIFEDLVERAVRDGGMLSYKDLVKIYRILLLHRMVSAPNLIADAHMHVWYTRKKILNNLSLLQKDNHLLGDPYKDLNNLAEDFFMRDDRSEAFVRAIIAAMIREYGSDPFSLSDQDEFARRLEFAKRLDFFFGLARGLQWEKPFYICPLLFPTLLHTAYRLLDGSPEKRVDLNERLNRSAHDFSQGADFSGGLLSAEKWQKDAPWQLLDAVSIGSAGAEIFRLCRTVDALYSPETR